MAPPSPRHRSQIHGWTPAHTRPDRGWHVVDADARRHIDPANHRTDQTGCGANAISTQSTHGWGVPEPQPACLNFSINSRCQGQTPAMRIKRYKKVRRGNERLHQVRVFSTTKNVELA